MLIIGSHVSLGGKEQFLGSVKEAVSYEANAFMVYTGAPQNTVRKPIGELKIPQAQALMATNGILNQHVVVHAPYIVNLANPDPVTRAFAVEFLSSEVRRTNALGAKTLVLHPGNHLNQGVSTAIRLIASGLDQIIENTKELEVIIALEGMAGKGTEVGRTFTELREIIDNTLANQRLGVCLDTCHSHDAGYPVKNDIQAVLGEFDNILGLKRLRVVHVNDSKNPAASGKDRHENFGFGEIGFEALMKIVYHPLLEAIPKILETPYVPSINDPKKTYPPYQEEIRMIRAGIFDPDMKQRVIARNQGES